MFEVHLVYIKERGGSGVNAYLGSPERVPHGALLASYAKRYCPCSPRRPATHAFAQPAEEAATAFRGAGAVEALLRQRKRPLEQGLLLLRQFGLARHLGVEAGDGRESPVHEAGQTGEFGVSALKLGESLFDELLGSLVEFDHPRRVEVGFRRLFGQGHCSLHQGLLPDEKRRHPLLVHRSLGHQPVEFLDFVKQQFDKLLRVDARLSHPTHGNCSLVG